MARPLKSGLDYFPLDVDIDQDDKVMMIESLHGVLGFGVLIKLLMKIYKEGYFYNWNERQQILFSRRINVDINSVKDVVNDCIEENIFDKQMFEEHQVLTSKGIQERFLEATKRRKSDSLITDYSLISVNLHKQEKPQQTPKNGVNVNINGVSGVVNEEETTVNDDISTQRKVKESKGKESNSSRHSFTVGDMENSKLLFELILDNNSNAKKPDLESWSNEFRLMRERDNRSDEQIKYLINWSQNDSFWKQNILSPSKLRKQFDALVIKVKTERENKSNVGFINKPTTRSALDRLIEEEQANEEVGSGYAIQRDRQVLLEQD